MFDHIHRNDFNTNWCLWYIYSSSSTRFLICDDVLVNITVKKLVYWEEELSRSWEQTQRNQIDEIMAKELLSLGLPAEHCEALKKPFRDSKGIFFHFWRISLFFSVLSSFFFLCLSVSFKLFFSLSYCQFISHYSQDQLRVAFGEQMMGFDSLKDVQWRVDYILRWSFDIYLRNIHIGKKKKKKKRGKRIRNSPIPRDGTRRGGREGRRRGEKRTKLSFHWLQFDVHWHLLSFKFECAQSSWGSFCCHLLTNGINCPMQRRGKKERKKRNLLWNFRWQDESSLAWTWSRFLFDGLSSNVVFMPFVCVLLKIKI